MTLQAGIKTVSIFSLLPILYYCRLLGLYNWLDTDITIYFYTHNGGEMPPLQSGPVSDRGYFLGMASAKDVYLEIQLNLPVILLLEPW